MSTIEALGIIAAALVTVFATAIASRPDMPAGTKRIIAGIFAAALGVIATIITGGIEGIPATAVAWISRTLVTIALVIVAGQGFHQAFKGVLDDIETSTTPRRAIPPGETEPVRSFGQAVEE